MEFSEENFKELQAKNLMQQAQLHSMLAVFLAYVQFRDGEEMSEKLKLLYIKSIPEQLDSVLESSGFSKEYFGDTLNQMLNGMNGKG